MNGEVSVVHKELIKNMEELEEHTPPRNCEFGYKVKSGLTRCLLVCDYLLSMQKVNTILLLVVLLFVVRLKGDNVIDLLVSLFAR